ncbi:hypothetical protein [Flavobacterium sp.]|uniref:hypothetical protein n=1 Tax=Flavobacterium sp. TaxID=239 RepID=UPI002489F5D7|nr:hypothetical protein [Flavobacterium sp.]MDI1318218.1 hypothetical protein [Flavobacterium sp.]
MKFEKNSLYLFCRGTIAKSGLIAEKFNNTDKKITHVGIGYLDNNVLKIYNVTDCDSTKTALIIDNLDSFTSNGTYYLSVWKCNNNEREFLKLKEICSAFSKRKVYFDFSFTLNKNDTVLYCSEFCSRVLKQINSRKFDFKPKKMILESYYKALLNREELIYYPVDFFQESPHFTKLLEITLKLKKS